jgi:hypothetical protein
MKRLFALCNILVLAGALVFCSAAKAQNSGAAGAPAQGNKPAGNAPQAGGRPPAGPIAGPAHDPHDLTGVWNVRGFANGFGRVPPLTPYGEQLY